MTQSCLVMEASARYGARDGAWRTISCRKTRMEISLLGPSRFAWRVERAAPFPRVRPLRG